MDTTTTDARDEPEPATGVGVSELYRVASDECRQCVVETIRDRGTPISLRELSVAVADELHDAGGADPTGLGISLHHVHLPLLDDAGAVTYDPEETVVVEHSDLLDGLAEL